MAGQGLTVVCPGCGHRSDRVSAEYAGRTARCPRCQASFIVPPAPAATLQDSLAPTVDQSSSAAPASAAGVAFECRIGDELFGLYQVVAILGEGGMGRVYRVRHHGWGLDLAMKVPLDAVLEALGGADLFEREAETWVRLGLHPHVVTCHYVRRVGAVPLVFAEFVDGASLADVIRTQSLKTLRDRLDVLTQLAWGLDHAHQQGLVHLDVKPANVLLGSDGVAKVTDFGLAGMRAGGFRAVAGQVGTERTLIVDGTGGFTPAYVSPEQAAGQALTRRSDVWSFGLTLLEALLGGRSWDYGPAAAEVLAQALALDAQRETPAIPARVGALLSECFREDPDERPHTLREAVDVLRDAYEADAGQPYPRPEPQIGQGLADGLNNRAVSLLDLGRRGEAEDLWRQALEREPQHLEAVFNQHMASWMGGRIDDDELLRGIGGAVTSHGGSARANQLLGRAYFALGDFTRARTRFEEAKRAEPTARDVERDLGLALVAGASGSEAWGRAGEVLARVLASGARDLAVVASYVECLVAQGQKEAAELFRARVSGGRRDLPSSLEALREEAPGRPTRLALRGLSAAGVALVVSDDGERILASGGRELRQWDALAGSPKGPLPVPSGAVHALALLADGRTLLCGGDAGIEVIDLTNERPMRSFSHQPGAVMALAVLRDGTRVLSGGTDRIVRLWELESGRCVRVMEGHGDRVTSVVAGPRTAVSASRDGGVHVWDLTDGRMIASLEGHSSRVNALGFDDDRGRVVTGGEDGALRVWDLQTGAPTRVYRGHTHGVSALAVAPGVSFVVTGGVDGTVRVWDLDVERLLSIERLDAAIGALALGPDGTVWAACGATVHALRRGPGRSPAFVLARPHSAGEEASLTQTFGAHLDEARRAIERGEHGRAVELARTARSVPGHERALAALAVWDEACAELPRRGLRGAWEEGEMRGGGDQVLTVALAPTGRTVLSGGMDGAVLSFDIESGRFDQIGRHQGPVAAVAVSGDGARGASGSWDGTVQVWDLARRRALQTLEGHEGYVTAVQFSPNGQDVVSGSLDETVRIWSERRPVAVLRGHRAEVSSVAIGPDARLIASGSWDGTVRVWDGLRGDCARVLEGHEGRVNAVAVSPDGLRLASGGQDGRVRIWDPRQRRPQATLTGHEGEVTAVRFSPDARFLVTAGRDAAVRVFDVDGGQCERTLAHPAPVLCVDLAPLGNFLASGGADGAIRRWHLDWEPETGRRVDWRKAARPFLEVAVTLQLTARSERPGAGGDGGGLDPAPIMEQLRHRGIGDAPRQALMRELRRIQEQGGSSLWNEMYRGVAQAVRPVARLTPGRGRWPWRGIALGAAFVGISFVAALAWRRPAPSVRILPKAAEAVTAELDLIDLGAFGEACDPGGLEMYLDRCSAPEVSAPDLACLVESADATTVDQFLSRAGLADPADPLRDRRLVRNAVSVMTHLGQSAILPLCAHLSDPSPDVRRVASLSLGRTTTAGAVECLRQTSRTGTPIARASATAGLRQAIAGGRLRSRDAFALLRALASDPDPLVRIEALQAHTLFTPSLAATAVSSALSDPDPDVAATARDVLSQLAHWEKVESGPAL